MMPMELMERPRTAAALTAMAATIGLFLITVIKSMQSWKAMRLELQ